LTDAARDRATTLLLRALAGLAPDERELVLHALLSGSIAGPTPGARRVPTSITEHFQVQQGRELGRQLEQPLLVRLPSALHARFRRWATDNGFTMAAVMRGLLERFLDDQDARG
jgi:hypothetical protein